MYCFIDYGKFKEEIKNSHSVNYNNKIKEIVNYNELIPDLVILALVKSGFKDITLPSHIVFIENCITFELIKNDIYAFFWFDTNVVKIKLRENHFKCFVRIR